MNSDDPRNPGNRPEKRKNEDSEDVERKKRRQDVFDGVYPMVYHDQQLQVQQFHQEEVIDNQAEPMDDQNQRDQQLQDPEVEKIVNQANCKPMKEQATRFADLPAEEVAKILNYAVPTDHQVREYIERINLLLCDYQPDRNNGSDPAFHRPNITYHGICALAVRNSPSGYVTTQDVNQFCKFHFPYFRTSSADSKHIRRVLYRKPELFTAYQYVDGEGKEHVVFGFAPNADSDRLLGQADREYMECQDPRGHEYYVPLLHCQDMFLWIPDREEA